MVIKPGKMGIEKLIVGQLQTNCYLVWDQSSREAILIDPGDDAELIANRARDLDLNPILIVATHGHFDHLLAANELKWAWGVSLALHKKDAFLVRRLRSSTRHWTGQESGPAPEIERFLKESDLVSFGQKSLSILETPGHTPGGISLYDREEGRLFSGDTLFKRGFGRTDFEYASTADLENSLQKLFKLPPETIVYPGHGAPTTIGAESVRIRF